MAAAGPASDMGGYDHDLDTEVISIPAITKVKDPVRLFSVLSDFSKYRDPLHLLQEYIAEVRCLFLLPAVRPILTWTMQRASDCDMVLTHDDDLVTIEGLGHDAVSRLWKAVTLSTHIGSQ